MRTPLILLAVTAVVVFVSPAIPSAQSDLDAFMKQVLTRRDDNWKKLQQYTLEEDERFQMSALDGRKIYGFAREYTWYPTDDGIFVRSPVRADGVALSEDDRRAAEQTWIKREQGRRQAREKRADRQRAKEEQAAQEGRSIHGDSDQPPSIEDLARAGNAPQFVSSAYFMEFKFDEGSYAFAGREQMLGREVYKVEYYPHQFFKDPPKQGAGGRGRGERSQKDRDREAKFEEKMDKVSLITLWIEPKDHQILRYEFTNIDFDFMPGRSMVRLDDLRAEMRMREAFPDVWLPDTIGMRFAMTTALGDLQARYDVRYHDYKLAEVKARVR